MSCEEPASARLRAQLNSQQRGWWSDEQEQQLRDSERVEVLQCLERAERKPKPDIEELFNDVYAGPGLPPHLARQREELLEHMAQHPAYYRGGDH
jgi:hypothetical protein